MVLLDHLTRGRVMFGVGPGALPSDAFMMGIDPQPAAGDDGGGARGDPRPPRRRRAGHPRDGLVHAAGTPACSCGPTPSRASRCASRPRSRPPGPRAAGRFGGGLLSIGATSRGGFDVLGSHWTVMEERAAEFGQPTPTGASGASSARCTSPRPRSRPRQDVALRPRRLDRLLPEGRRPPARARTPTTPRAGRRHERLRPGRHRHARAGHRPDPAAGRPVRRLRRPSCSWPTSGRTGRRRCRSYELFAREVMPQLPGRRRRRRRESGLGGREPAEFIGAAGAAVMKAFQDHNAEKAAKAEATT